MVCGILKFGTTYETPITLRNINAFDVHSKHGGNFGRSGVNTREDVWDGDSPSTQISLSFVLQSFCLKSEQLSKLDLLVRQVSTDHS